VSSLTPAAEIRAEGAHRASWVTVAADVGHAVVTAVAIAYAVKPDVVLVTVAWVNSVKAVYVLVPLACTNVYVWPYEVVDVFVTVQSASSRAKMPRPYLLGLEEPSEEAPAVV
jgi:hypothetical protein